MPTKKRTEKPTKTENGNGFDKATKTRAKPVRSGITAEDFVAAWQAADSIDAVVEATGMGRGAATARAASYRKQRVALKMMGSGGRGKRVDWSSLSELAESLGVDTDDSGSSVQA